MRQAAKDARWTPSLRRSGGQGRSKISSQSYLTVNEDHSAVHPESSLPWATMLPINEVHVLLNNDRRQGLSMNGGWEVLKVHVTARSALPAERSKLSRLSATIAVAGRQQHHSRVNTSNVDDPRERTAARGLFKPQPFCNRFVNCGKTPFGQGKLKFQHVLHVSNSHQPHKVTKSNLQPTRRSNSKQPTNSCTV